MRSRVRMIQTLEDIFQNQMAELDAAQNRKTTSEQIFNLKGEAVEAEVERYGEIAAFTRQMVSALRFVRLVGKSWALLIHGGIPILLWANFV